MITEERSLKKRLYKMLRRCNNPEDKDYKYYGQKGISVCDEWMNNPDSFIKWSLNNGYKTGMTIERINTDKGYSPDNCKYIPMSEQPKNTDRNVFIEYNGEIHIMSEVARMEGVSCEAIRKRLRRNRYKKVPNPNKVEPTGNT